LSIESPAGIERRAKEIVRRIYKLYTEDRLGTIAIAHQLRAEHAPAPTAGWGHPAVHRVLTNPTYLGRIRWRNQDFASEHEPLIDPDTFQQAQTILAERGSDASRRRGNRSDFLLSGVIRCGHCGRAYIGMSAHGKGGTYDYYACTARQKYGPKACQGERVSREKLETAVLRQLTGIYRDGPLIHDALAAAQQQTQRERPALDECRHAIARPTSSPPTASSRPTAPTRPGFAQRQEKWRRWESNPRPQSRVNGFYERSRRPDLVPCSPRRRGCGGPAS
jgi:recombinase/recombinase-like zinc beta ribbon protein